MQTDYRLLKEFRELFDGKKYVHRSSTLGDWVAMHLYEDLVAIERSPKLLDTVARQDRVLNVQNRRRGVKARRGDGTFGELIPGSNPIVDPGYSVARGPVATIEIGVEVKILSKAMVRQVDRVINDLERQVAHFRRGGGDPICVAVIGVNHADRYTGYEGERPWPTTGKGKYLHPYQEAPKATRRLETEAKQHFDEFVILKYKARNEPPYPFEWVDYEGAWLDYGAALTRISSMYQRRF